MTDIAIVAAVRTPVGSFRGAFAPLSAVDLGAAVVRGLLERCQLPAAAVDELIFGQVLTAGCGQNPARQTALRAGLPVDTPAVTVNLVCGSGLKAVQQAVQAIRCGDAGIVIAGGQESMSNAPYLMHGARDGLRFGHASLQDSMIQDGLWDAFNDYHMGITAENLADAFDISRERQDAFAASSQRKAAAAIAAGRFREEIVPVSVPQGKKPPRVVTDDEQPRPETSEQQLAQLRPAFRPADGSVTAGNASSLNDGAAAVLLMRVDKARELGLPVLARIVSSAVAGVDPSVMGIGPVSACRQALQRAGWTLDEVDLIEANEAFAVQALAVGQLLEWDSEKVNVNGGAIALGHPIGASGCRILVSLVHEMQRRGASKGLATLCGHTVRLYDTDPQRLAEVPAVASAILCELEASGQQDPADRDAVLARLTPTPTLNALADATLLIEAIPERLALKHALYAELETLIADEAIIASNTSGLPPDRLAQGMRLPERLLIAHFWHPPHLIPLVEVVPGSATLPHLARQVSDFCAACALEAVVLNRAAPGFVGNRLQFALLREALHIVHSGIASPEVVDQVMRASLGRRYAMVGPLEAADMTGLATVQDICQHLLPELASGTEMMSLVAEKVARGDTGARSGQGFYRWDEARHQRIQSRREHQLRFALKP